MPNLPPLSPRLSAALPYIRRGDTVADIGTDHAYLPIYLVLSGLSPISYACDINEGPCMRARDNAREYGVSDKIKISKRDGICGLESEKIDKFTIFGMGGELISSIMDASPSLPIGTGFILNPMTKAASLRSYLVSHGYSILDDTYARAEGKIYQIIYAEKTGNNDTLSPLELALGKHALASPTPIMIEYVEKLFHDMSVAAEGRRRAGATSPDDALLCDIEGFLSDYNKTYTKEVF